MLLYDKIFKFFKRLLLRAIEEVVGYNIYRTRKEMDCMVNAENKTAFEKRKSYEKALPKKMSQKR